MLDNTKGLIFDCDGTLVDSAPLYAKAWGAGFAVSGAVMADDWYHDRKGLSEHVLMQSFEDASGLTLDRSATIATMREAFLAKLTVLREIAAVGDIARAVVTVHGLAKPVAILEVAGPRRPHFIAFDAGRQGRPLHASQRLTYLETQLRVERKRTIVVGGLHEAHTGGAPLCRPVHDCRHQELTDPGALEIWVDRNRAHTRYCRALVEKVRTYHPAINLSHHRIETPVRERRRS